MGYFALSSLLCNKWKKTGPSAPFILRVYVQVITEKYTILIIKKHDISHITKTSLCGGIKTKLIVHRLSEGVI